MRQSSRILARFLSVAAVMLILAVLPVPLLAQEDPEPPVSFSTEEVVTIESVAEVVAEGKVRFSPGDEPEHIIIAIDGTVLLHDVYVTPLSAEKHACMACVETIHLAPDMRIPLKPFFVDEAMANMNPEIVEDGKISITVGPRFAEEGYVDYSFEGVVLDFLVPIEDGDEVIVSGPEGATLTKEGNGFLLVEGEATYMLAGQDAASTDEPDVLIELTERNAPGKPLKLDVITGDYELVNGLTLQPGSSFWVHEDWMTFPSGLAIDVGEGGVTLKGKDYAEGTRLIVNDAGTLTVSTTSVEATVETIRDDLPSYSEVIATYPPDADLCNTDATVIGGSDGSWKVKGTVSIRNGKFTYHCLGAKITLAIDTTWDDGNDYPAGTLLTVDADFNWVPVSSWD